MAHSKYIAFVMYGLEPVFIPTACDHVLCPSFFYSLQINVILTSVYPDHPTSVPSETG